MSPNDVNKLAPLPPPTSAPQPGLIQDTIALADGSSITLSGRVIGRGIHILGQVIIARSLGPELFGIYVIGWTIFRIVLALMPVGLHNSIIHFGPKYWRQNDARFKGLLQQIFAISLLFGLASAVGIAVVGSPIGRLADKSDLPDMLTIFAIAILFGILAKTVAAATRVTKKMQYATLSVDLAQPLALLIIFIPLNHLGLGLKGAALAASLSFVVAFILAIYFAIRLFPELLDGAIKSEFSIRATIRHALPTAFAGVFGMLILWTDRLTIGFLRPAADAGIYQAASQYSFIFLLIQTSLAGTFAPIIANLYHRDELKQIEKLYRINTRWGVYLAFPALLTFLVVPSASLTVVFGPAYAEGATALIILTLAQFIHIAGGAIAMLLLMTGHQKQWFRISATMLATNLVLNILLVPRLGLEGAALATLAAYGLLFMLGLAHVRGILSMWPYDRRYIKGLVAAAASALAVALLQPLFGSTSLLQLFGTGISAVVVFGVLAVILQLEDEDRLLLRFDRRK